MGFNDQFALQKFWFAMSALGHPARSEWPRSRRSTEQRNELTPPHVFSQAKDCTLPHRQSGCASQQIQVANVRFGSKAAAPIVALARQLFPQ
jgi:hypothetical protein